MSELKKALEEINAIEQTIKPYEYQVPEASDCLKDLATIKELLKNPTRVNIAQALEKLKTVENRINYYRGYEPAEVALRHINRLKDMARSHGLI